MNATEVIDVLRHDAYSLRRSAAGELLAAAADMIENQQRHIDALIQANDALRLVWVPTSERLPGRDGQYLCLRGFIQGGRRSGKLYPDVLDYYATASTPHFQYEGYLGIYVSHWMPLPPAPEVE